MQYLLILLVTLMATNVIGQPRNTVTTDSNTTKEQIVQPTLSGKEVDDLFILGKLWGFLKYHHPAIAKGKHDWDKELIQFIPSCKMIKDKRQRNDSLLAWTNRLGEIAKCDSCSDNTSKSAALRPDFSWINPRTFSKELAEKLLYIRANRSRGNQHYISFFSDEGISVATFEHENLYTSMIYPPAEYRLLALFRYWNIIEYWYPYKYGLGQSWDAVLKKFIPLVVAARNASEYAAVIQQLVTTIQDSHAVIRSKTITEEQGKYYMPFTIRFIEQKAVIVDIVKDTLANISGIMKGDIIESIDGVTVKELVHKNRAFIPASNNGSYLNIVRSVLTRGRKPNNELIIKRGGQLKKVTVQNYFAGSTPYIKPGTFSLERDSSTTIIEDSIGYINLGNFQLKDSLKLRTLVSSVKGLIIDNRQYPKGLSAGITIANTILPPGQKFMKFSSPNPGNPGLFLFSEPSAMGTEGTTGYFPPRIAILINEETQSAIEFQAMAFRKSPGAVLIGTRTAGADGNIAMINLPGGIYTSISGLGVYYPDGKETQRVGIAPDIEVKPTIEGFLKNKDELLERAIIYVKNRK